jgi:hypothetical protein
MVAFASLSRILRGEILFKALPSRAWKYERSWHSICVSSGGPTACRKRSWRIVRRSIVPTSAPSSEASTLPALTLWTGWRGFSGLKPRISSRGHHRPMIKKEAEVNLAHSRRKGVRSQAVPFASRTAEPASHGRADASTADPQIPDRPKIATLGAPSSGSCATGLPAARLSPSSGDAFQQPLPLALKLTPCVLKCHATRPAPLFSVAAGRGLVEVWII